MNKSDRKRAEYMLKNYQSWKNQIKLRIESIKHPTPPDDDNWGGGKSNNISKPQETLMIAIDEDDTINRLKHNCEAIEYALNATSDMIRNFVKLFYFKKSGITVAEYIKANSYSRRAFYSQMNDLLSDILHNHEIIFS